MQGLWPVLLRPLPPSRAHFPVLILGLAALPMPMAPQWLPWLDPQPLM
jgi:hypothetical protein